MKPLILTAASKQPGAARFIQTLKPYAKQVEYISVEFDPAFPDDIEGHDWWVDFPDLLRIKIVNQKFPGRMKRHGWLYKSIESLGKIQENDGRFVIFSDTADVFFQGSPDIHFDPGKRIYLANEGENWDKTIEFTTIIKKYPSFKKLAGTPVYNSGLWMMRMSEAISWWQYALEIENEKKYQDDPSLEKLAFCMWLLTKPDIVKTEHSYLLGALETNLHEGNILVNGDGKFTNQKGDLISIIHANGDTKEEL